MKFCSRCGKEIHDDAVICVHCGCSVENVNSNEIDAPNTGFSILGFFFPIVGLILYLVYKDKLPLKAKSAGKGALIGVCASAALSILGGMITGAMLGTLTYYA